MVIQFSSEMCRGYFLIVDRNKLTITSCTIIAAIVTTTYSVNYE